MKVTIDMVTAHGNNVQVEAVVLSGPKAVEQLIQALRKAKKLVWPEEKEANK